MLKYLFDSVGRLRIPRCAGRFMKENMFIMSVSLLEFIMSVSLLEFIMSVSLLDDVDVRNTTTRTSPLRRRYKFLSNSARAAGENPDNNSRTFSLFALSAARFSISPIFFSLATNSSNTARSSPLSTSPATPRPAPLSSSSTTETNASVPLARLSPRT